MAPNETVCLVKEDQSPSFTINGIRYKIDSSISPFQPLLFFIRDVAQLTGAKGCCYEGGCGSCTVVATAIDNETKQPKKFSLRSCQTLVYSCIGWAIETVEHLGNRYEGYDKIQTALTGFSGTQCGFCTPGFVMTMHGEKESTDNLKMSQIENAFDGNICRCTGYRPILDAFKSMASDAPKDLTDRLTDIEEVAKQCTKTGKLCSGKCESSASCADTAFEPQKSLSFQSCGVMWQRPKSMEEVYNIMKDSDTNKVRFVVGNTGRGVYKKDGPYNTFIDTTGIEQLYLVDKEKALFGANLSLSRCIKLFDEMSKRNGYVHLKEIANAWKVVANVGVRNTGCWAANLAMKRLHPEFVSDIFLSLVAIDARLSVSKPGSRPQVVSVEEYQKLNSNDLIILHMEIPSQKENYVLRYFKITPRAVNAHAYLNAAFKFELTEGKQSKVISKPYVLLGGVSSTFVHAKKTESVLIGKCVKDSKTISSAMVALKEDLSDIVTSPLETSPEYRTELAKSLLYKMFLLILGDNVDSSVKSGATNLERPISSGKQIFDANADTWPIGQAMPKIESKHQVSGEAKYVNDVSKIPGELVGVFIQSKYAKATIESICAKACKHIPGFVDFITADDIPGINSFGTDDPDGPPNPPTDPIFANGKVEYAGQSIGLVVATNMPSAFRAARLIDIVYSNIQKPVVDTKEAIELGRVSKVMNFKDATTNDIVVGDVNIGFGESEHVVEGTLMQETQFHFPIEPHSALVVPVEDGYDVWVTSQFLTEAQVTLASCLSIENNNINVTIPRLGGAFGSKISRCHIVSCAAGIAAHKLHKPVRITLDLATHMTLVGWREPYYAKYKIGFTSDGLLKAVDVHFYSDVGFVTRDCSMGLAALILPNCYHCPNWLVRPYAVETDVAASTYCRTPGHVEAMGLMEHMMDHVAHVVKKKPLEIREKNFIGPGKPLGILNLFQDENIVQTMLLPALRERADLDRRMREVDVFNKNNRWKKRGIATMPMYYNFPYFPIFKFNALVAIYEADGTVALHHGGVEMGQGINTKVVQVAAKILQIPVDFIKVKAANTFVGANSTCTGGSHGSDLCAFAIKVCCEKLRGRMDPVEETMKKEGLEVKWLDLVKRCTKEQVDMSARYQIMPKDYPKGYDIWGAAITDVEIDVLTGQFMILRTDIMEDCGRSLSPYVDVGQVEGAYVMGMGLYTTERAVFNQETGQRLSVGTWDYKPPSAADIPVDFRVSFLPKSDNLAGVVRSKATGEPALCLSYSIIMALRQAIMSAREDAGHSDWIDMHTPLTVEKIRQHCEVVSSQFTI